MTHFVVMQIISKWSLKGPRIDWHVSMMKESFSSPYCKPLKFCYIHTAEIRHTEFATNTLCI